MVFMSSLDVIPFPEPYAGHEGSVVYADSQLRGSPALSGGTCARVVELRDLLHLHGSPKDVKRDIYVYHYDASCLPTPCLQSSCGTGDVCSLAGSASYQCRRFTLLLHNASVLKYSGFKNPESRAYGVLFVQLPEHVSDAIQGVCDAYDCEFPGYQGLRNSLRVRAMFHDGVPDWDIYLEADEGLRKNWESLLDGDGDRLKVSCGETDFFSELKCLVEPTVTCIDVALQISHIISYESKNHLIIFLKQLVIAPQRSLNPTSDSSEHLRPLQEQSHEVAGQDDKCSIEPADNGQFSCSKGKSHPQLQDRDVNKCGVDPYWAQSVRPPNYSIKDGLQFSGGTSAKFAWPSPHTVHDVNVDKRTGLRRCTKNGLIVTGDFVRILSMEVNGQQLHGEVISIHNVPRENTKEEVCLVDVMLCYGNGRPYRKSQLRRRIPVQDVRIMTTAAERDDQLAAAPPSGVFSLRMDRIMLTAPNDGLICIFWDTEATGLCPLQDDITQIGSVARFFAQGEWVDARNFGPTQTSRKDNYFSRYVATDRIIPECVQRLTGINSELLKAKGVPLDQALTEWTDWIRSVSLTYAECPIWMAAHNGNQFDLPLLTCQEHTKCNRKIGSFLGEINCQGIVDTLVLSRTLKWDTFKGGNNASGSRSSPLAKGRRSHKLVSLYEDVMLETMVEAHDALEDANALALVMTKDPFLEAWRNDKIAWPISDYFEAAKWHFAGLSACPST